MSFGIKSNWLIHLEEVHLLTHNKYPFLVWRKIWLHPLIIQLCWSTYVGGKRSCRLKVTEDSSGFSMELPEGGEVRDIEHHFSTQLGGAGIG